MSITILLECASTQRCRLTLEALGMHSRFLPQAGFL